MTNLTHVSSAASSAAQKANTSAIGADSHQDASDEPSEFNSMFENVVESERKQNSAMSATNDQKSGNPDSAFASEKLPQSDLEAGNGLPAEDTAAMWQALLLMQPGEAALNNATVNSNQPLQSGLLLDQQKKSTQHSALIQNNLLTSGKAPSSSGQPTSLLNASLLDTPPLEQGYYQNMVMQKQTEFGMPTAGNPYNQVSTQLAAAHFTPERNEALLLNLSDQLPVSPAGNTNLHSGLLATGLAGATQAASINSQMAPLNLGQNAWETNFGSRLQMMVGQKIQTAEIRLDPPELGALDIKIKVNNDIASVNITSPHSQVREALESAVPRLREMFAESGISLGDVNVRQESHTEQQYSADDGDAARSGSGLSKEEEAISEPATLSRLTSSNNLLDIYA